MIDIGTEKRIREYVTDNLNGAFRGHCSDDCLVAMLKTAVDRAEGQDEGRFYFAGCEVFEGVLEHGCKAAVNGHHSAQAFSRFLAAGD